MRQLITISFFLCLGYIAQAQSYSEQIAAYRQHYKQEFLTDEHSPLKAADTGYLDFFSLDRTYCVKARFAATPDAQPFDMPTHSGKTKKFRQYGLLTFTIHDTTLTLQVFQNLANKNPKYKDELFIPFTDGTTYSETYGGGRYLDIQIPDIKNNEVMLDFNKCYNPYCAYAGGYSCPIPPVENRLPVAIKAGEKNWTKAEK